MLLGSFNWLSYRGDYNLRNESVIVTQDSVVIKETTEYIEEKFLTALEQDLQQLLRSTNCNIHPPDSTGLPCCIGSKKSLFSTASLKNGNT
ncbi:hypothetical protein [Exiguobacterium sp. ZWU0009]|uniref:hypothetical protein n=1 Tax=Exiguobacterium sp. ZWU0009 TaxID=1224749 RepID=UPI000645C45C|nr:hypothetical protein [Exiguobacterium sp. ZWU0009]